MVDDSIRIGDFICLYCEDSAGYIFSEGSSTANNGLFVKCHQLREKPTNVPDPHTVVFEVVVKNRYKADREYRRYQEMVKHAPNDLHLQSLLSKAKIASEAENEENKLEQRRQNKRHLKYGQIIQLRHKFTGKFIQVSETHTSSRNTNYMRVHLEEQNGKQAQFLIHPRYKVKSEGDIVQEGDQIVLESVKSRGQYLHASSPYKIDNFIHNGSEINLGVERSGCTLLRFFRPEKHTNSSLRGGSVVQLFHKEIEGYLVADGTFNDSLSQDVHLRERPIDPSRPKSVFPSTSAITYWQVEQENSVLNGSIIQWNHQIRLRHMTSRQYLSISARGKVALTTNTRDPNSVFLMHPVIEECDEVTYDSYIRIEHVLTRQWLHALRDQPFIGMDFILTKSESGIKGLKWDKAKTKQIGLAAERQYDDVFTLQKVSSANLVNFNFVSGMVTFVQNMCIDSERDYVAHSSHTSCTPVPTSKLLETIQCLAELQKFMTVNGMPNKDRQKLLRNLKIVDLLVRYLRTKPEHFELNELHRKTFVQAYSVLETYLQGNSMKNGLYFAKHIDYFSTQYGVAGEIGEKATTMITELIRDNRKIIDRIPREDINRITELVKEFKNYRFLDLLGVLCVCESVALPENQTYICEKWLAADKKGVYLIEMGDGMGRNPNKMYVSTDIGETWSTLDDFCATTLGKEEYNFLVSQLDLYDKICTGRNSYAIDLVTKGLKYLTWQDAFKCLSDDSLPHSLRANYAHLIISLFIDVGNSQSFLDQLSISYIYDELSVDPSTNENSYGKNESDGKEIESEDSRKIFEQLKPWIAEFLDDNTNMTASQVGYNQLVEQVLALVFHLVKFGYYADKNDIKRLLPSLLDLVDGTDDDPFLVPEGYDIEGKDKDDPDAAIISEYRAKGRFEQNRENQAIVDSKYKAMEVVDLLLNVEFNTRLERFYGLYKSIAETEVGRTMSIELEDCSNAVLRYNALLSLDDIIETTALFNKEQITDSLMDLLNYKYDKMVTKSMYLLNKYFSSSDDLFRKAIQGQVLITEKSIKVHQTVRKAVPMLKRLYKTKIGPKQAGVVVSIMTFLKSLCHLQDEPHVRHAINQTILLNHGMLDILFALLSKQVDLELMAKYSSLCEALTASLEVLQHLIKGNRDVQSSVFNRLDTLLSIEGLDVPLANALTEVFIGNQTTCLKITPKQIEKIVDSIATLKEKASEYLLLLTAIVKVEELDLPLKRNQGYVMRIMMAHYNEVAYIMQKPSEVRRELLTKEGNNEHTMYYVRLVDLFATCAEGENRFIESVCQTVFSIDDLVDVLNDDGIRNDLKRPFLRFLLWVYVSTSSTMSTSGVHDIPFKIPPFLRDLVQHLRSLAVFTKNNKDKVAQYMTKTKPVESVADSEEMQACSTLILLLDAGLPFIEVFFRKSLNLDRLEADGIPNALAYALFDFHEAAGSLISDKNQLQNLTQSILSVLTKATIESWKVQSFLKTCKNAEVENILSESQKKYQEYYYAEQQLNHKLYTFSRNYNLLYRGDNDCQEQLSYNGSRPYNDDGAVPLPLGLDFQDFINIFIDETSDKNRYNKASRLIEQLYISAFKMGERERNHPIQVELDVKCIQVLRAMIHNEERKLPADWEKLANDHEDQLGVIEDVQNAMNAHGAILKTLPLIERQGDVAREYLAFLTTMLFNACKSSQDAFGEHCKNSRDEALFVAIREKLQLSMQATKERRLLAAFVDARHRENEERRLALADNLDMSSSKQEVYAPGKTVDEDFSEDLVETEDEGNIELVLRCLALMCDGQNKVLQDYLREQPENMKSVNLVAESTSYLSLIYSSISESNVDLCIELFTTLNEFASGNPANRNIIFEHGIVDYINHILRSGKYQDVAEEDQALDLEENIKSLLMTMIEESRPETFAENKEICTTLDLNSIKAVAIQNYQTAVKLKDDDFDDHMRVAFGYHFIIEKVAEYSGLQVEDMYEGPEETAILEYFWDNSSSIEIMKDGELQKIHFRVKDVGVLREEVKEMVKWNVDRSSSSTKIREFMDWSKDIVEDIYYQLEIRKNPFADFLIKNWRFWNDLCILLSLFIHLIMLATWEPKGAMGKIVIPEDVKKLPNEIYDPVPQVGSWFRVTCIVLGIIHNISALFVFITYFLTARPRVCKVENLMKKLTPTVGAREVFQKERKNQLRTDLLGVETSYYCLFLVMSVMGTIFWGYFFAFHLFNLVTNSPILQRVVMAVTRNGTTLVWVAILVIIVVYNCSLTAFALYRSTLDPFGELPFFGYNLFQTFIVILRYGIIGELYEKMKPHYETEIEFGRVAQIFFFHMVMWTAIQILGHNLFLGVIIDTFGELRGLKNAAENDMKRECYICGRESYEFESQAKGFQYHVKNEHNMWAYLFFFIHLKSIKETDYTTLELYIHKQILEGRYDFFPIGRSMALSHMNDNVTDEKLEEMAKDIKYLLQRAKKEEIERQKERERRRQVEWENTHRHLVGQVPSIEHVPRGLPDPMDSITSASQVLIGTSQMNAVSSESARSARQIHLDTSQLRAGPTESTTSAGQIHVDTSQLRTLPTEGTVSTGEIRIDTSQLSTGPDKSSTSMGQIQKDASQMSAGPTDSATSTPHIHTEASQLSTAAAQSTPSTHEIHTQTSQLSTGQIQTQTSQLSAGPDESGPSTHQIHTQTSQLSASPDESVPSTHQIQTQTSQLSTGQIHTQTLPPSTGQIHTQTLPPSTGQIHTQTLPPSTGQIHTQTLPPSTGQIHTQTLPPSTGQIHTQTLPPSTGQIHTQTSQLGAGPTESAPSTHQIQTQTSQLSAGPAESDDDLRTASSMLTAGTLGSMDDLSDSDH